MSESKPFLKSALLPVLMFLIMSGAYAAFFYLTKAQSLADFVSTIEAVPSIRVFGSSSAAQVKDIFSTYGALAGLALGLMYLVLAYILLGLFAIVRLTKQAFGTTLALLVSLIPFVILGWGFVYSSNTNTAIAAGIVYFVGRPLWYTSLTAAGIAALLFILSFKYGKTKTAQA